ncbi:hypothetical protein C8R45DRAFT_1083830 [Mycena sanguinolenta]|nr:hypothetical protein C8R45DRAFT_1083830 [Mycena sanguinolenta]
MGFPEGTKGREMLRCKGRQELAGESRGRMSSTGQQICDLRETRLREQEDVLAYGAEEIDEEGSSRGMQRIVVNKQPMKQAQYSGREPRKDLEGAAGWKVPAARMGNPRRRATRGRIIPKKTSRLPCVSLAGKWRAVVVAHRGAEQRSEQSVAVLNVTVDPQPLSSLPPCRLHADSLRDVWGYACGWMNSTHYQLCWDDTANATLDGVRYISRIA